MTNINVVQVIGLTRLGFDLAAFHRGSLHSSEVATASCATIHTYSFVPYVNPARLLEAVISRLDGHMIFWMYPVFLESSHCIPIVYIKLNDGIKDIIYNTLRFACLN